MLLVLFIGAITLSANNKLDNATCVKCHPQIFKEYENSMHKNASIYNDPVHKAVWDLHPAKKKGNYKCAKCHTPADKELVAGKRALSKNAIQIKEPISCQTCHQIKRIEEHIKANKNIYTKEKKTFYAANKEKKGTKLIYHDQKSFLGLFKTRVGSPYHDIDYSNENFYNAKVCLGCHDHKQNGKNFMICDMQIKESNSSKDTCITCHMPKEKGSFVNLHDSKTHRFHGATALVSRPSRLSKYILLSLEQESEGFTIMIENKANHTLAMQPLRLAKLKVTISRDGQIIAQEEQSFQKVIGTDGKPSMPWLATEVLHDKTIKAFEKRKVHFETKLEKGDEIVAKFGYHIVNPKVATKLGISDKKLLKFVVLTKKRFSF